jgi:hypothetical protein
LKIFKEGNVIALSVLQLYGLTQTKQVAGEKKKTINIQQHNSKSIFQ